MITDSTGTISFGNENFTTTGNITANTFIGDGSLLTGIDGMDYTNLALTNTTNTFTGTQTIVGDLNVTGSFIGVGGGDADYEFGANNFNGSGNFTTTGTTTTGGASGRR